jgi:surface polysaccharide O-acyltransferase-like enzyme
MPRMERRYDIDWLRVYGMLAVFIYHCTRFFDTEGWHLKNADQSFVLFILMRGFMWPWLMELFFLLSGVGAWYLLRTRSAGGFVVDRAKRLLIPLYTVGLCILIPPQYYFELITNEGYKGSFWQSVPGYFEGWDIPRLTAWPTTLLNLAFGGHLWFLRFLFLISLVALPLLVFLKSPRGLRWIDALARWCDRRGGVFVFAVPLALTLVILRRVFPVERGWAEFVWYAIYFLIGFIIPADGRFTEAFKRHRWVGLPLWLVGFFGGIGVLVLGFKYDPAPGAEPFSIQYVLFQVIWAVASWGSVVFLLGLGARYLNFNNRALGYANEAVLPFYVFHQTIILMVGYYVIRWPIVAPLKFVIIAVLSFAAIMALYEFGVRRIGVMRFLFGMRPLKRSDSTRVGLDPVLEQLQGASIDQKKW